MAGEPIQFRKRGAVTIEYGSNIYIDNGYNDFDTQVATFPHTTSTYVYGNACLDCTDVSKILIFENGSADLINVGGLAACYECWVAFPDAQVGEVYTLCTGRAQGASSTRHRTVAYEKSAGGIYRFVHSNSDGAIGSGTGYDFWNFVSNPYDGYWHHVALIMDNNIVSAGFCIFVDGYALSKSTGGHWWMGPNFTQWYGVWGIGAGWTPSTKVPNSHWRGYIDEFMCYNNDPVYFTKGTYAEQFDPQPPGLPLLPAGQYPPTSGNSADPNMALLLHFDGISTTPPVQFRKRADAKPVQFRKA